MVGTVEKDSVTTEFESTPEFGPPTLIASDVDGTLIDDNNAVTRRTLDVLHAATAAGTHVVLATGRPPRWIPEITEQFDGTGVRIRYAVCANGAIVFDLDRDQVLHASTLEPVALQQLAEIAYREIPGCGLAAERVGESAYDAATPPFVATAGYRHAWLNPDHIEVSDDEICAEPAVKLLVRQPDMASDEMAKRLRDAVGDTAQVTFSTDNGLIELSVPDTHKATGLQRLIELTGLPGDAVVAFGDMPNDAEMLAWAHHGVAMGHAHPMARDAANEVTVGNNEDGVAEVLSRWFG